MLAQCGGSTGLGIIPKKIQFLFLVLPLVNFLGYPVLPKIYVWPQKGACHLIFRVNRPSESERLWFILISTRLLLDSMYIIRSISMGMYNKNKCSVQSDGSTGHVYTYEHAIKQFLTTTYIYTKFMSLLRCGYWLLTWKFCSNYSVGLQYRVPCAPPSFRTTWAELPQ